MHRIYNLLRRIFTIHCYEYIIMKKSLEDMAFYLPSTIRYIPITSEDALLLPTDYFPQIERKRNFKRLDRDPKLISGYKFYDNSTQEFVGFCWIIKKGGADSYFRIRNTDAYISELYISKDLRGKGYGGKILASLFNILKKDSIKTVILVVKPDNINAIKCYKKIGFYIAGEIKFKRVLRQNFPYHEI